MTFTGITEPEFLRIKGIVYDRFGINLTDNKKTLVVERLQKVIRNGNFESFNAYFDYILKEPTGEAMQEMTDLISTHHTYFFREVEHFNYIKDVMLPEIISRGQKTINIWSAGCSSGEESYSLAITILEYLAGKKVELNTSILATDISLSTLKKAADGFYTDEQLKDIPDRILKTYFEKHQGLGYEAGPKIKSMITFGKLNLMNEHFPFKKKFDLIICRNVMIYFDKETRTRLIDSFYKYNSADGWLFVGHAETVDRVRGNYRYVKPAIYRSIKTLGVSDLTNQA
jgi:chemotaxis protein methyltransferase CheR